MCCLKLKGRRDIRTGRESTGIENYGSSSVSEKTNKQNQTQNEKTTPHRGYSQDQSRDITNSEKTDFTTDFLGSL